VTNRPGLSAIAYRVGTHAQFRETLLARLSGSGQPALSGLTTRDNDDFSIALLDAWATVGDVLTFYQERIANEAYLRTATERLSVLELARLINYELRPGVAASAYLAFTIEDAPGAAGQALAVGTTAQVAPEQLAPTIVGVGTKVMSIPGPGEKPQTFETVEEIIARPEWNGIRPRMTQPQNNTSFVLKAVIVDGTATELKKGDLLLIKDGVNLRPRKISSIKIDDDANTTRVDFTKSPPKLPAYKRPSGLTDGLVNEFPPNTKLTESVVEKIISETWEEPDFSALATIQNWPSNSLTANIKSQVAERNLAASSKVFAYRQQAALFGYNAPKQPTYDGTKPKPPSQWTDWDLAGSEKSTRVFLDRAYDAILPGSYITIEKAGKRNTFQVETVTTLPRTAYGISSKTTLLTLTTSWWGMLPKNPKLTHFRDVVIHAQSEQLDLAELPIDAALKPNSVIASGITLDGPNLGLASGRRVILSGEREDLKGVFASETLTVKDVVLESGFTVITLNQSLSHSYVRKTVTINANVANATHGETVQETLGSGDATQSFQRFTLRQPPLTYVSSSGASGAQSTLEIRVNDILWHEVADFFGHGPDERVYTTLLDDNGKTTVIFGDGKTGARPSTGQENIKAKYRKGIGVSGLVKANQLSQLMSRPFGVKGVTNPNAATGAADPEVLSDARRNAPLTVLTLGRIVSLRDYEDFARSFTGINKAAATWTWFGEKRGVFVTVAGVAGAGVSENTPLFQNLLSAMRGAGNPLVPLLVKSYQPRLFRVAASLKVDPDFLPENVLGDAEQKLRDQFSFDSREFGQPVHLSEVIAALQSVSGVIAVNVTGLYRSGQPAVVNKHLAAAAPRPGDKNVLPAEMLTLDPQPLELGTFQ
jgi:predicted phage baseplate assembly protein